MESRRTEGNLRPEMDHGMETRMRLRGHFIGALTLVFISIACASVNATSTGGAIGQHGQDSLLRPAPGAPWTRLEGFATAEQLLAELFDLSQLHAAR
jgi:hypothetical protein